MSLNSESKHYDAYYDHVLNKQKAVGNIAKIYDLINDLSDRRGLRHEWENIDGDIQDEIIGKWLCIIDGNSDRLAKDTPANGKTIEELKL